MHFKPDHPEILYHTVHVPSILFPYQHAHYTSYITSTQRQNFIHCPISTLVNKSNVKKVKKFLDTYVKLKIFLIFMLGQPSLS